MSPARFRCAMQLLLLDENFAQIFKLYHPYQTSTDTY